MSVVGGGGGENDGTVLVEDLNGVINKLRVFISIGPVAGVAGYGGIVVHVCILEIAMPFPYLLTI